MSLVGEAMQVLGDATSDTLSGILESILNATIYRLLYYIAAALCRIVDFLDQMFRVFAGIDKVTYNGEQDYLVNVFFKNNAVSNIYWGMALIGIVLCFGFAVAAMVRKMFDAEGKVQQSIGQTITSLLQSVLLILGMSAIMVVVLNSTNILMQQVNYIFNDAKDLDIPVTIQYTDEQFAAMGRALNTVGNYSLNPSYTSRYNINACFNAIRQDLYQLEQQGVFRYYYNKTDANGNQVNSWQSLLQEIAKSADLRSDLLMDKSYESVTTAILNTMDAIRNDSSLKPLSSFTRSASKENMVPLDRLVFLMGTTHAAQNPTYNTDAAMDDPVRGPYYEGKKSIYELTSVNADFNLGLGRMDYLIIFVAGVALIFDLLVIILNCVARIFNLMFLYLIAPPVLAARPYDSGGKTKQWMIAFLVQSFSVFGTVIAMRLLLIFLPIIVSPKLVLFPNNNLLNLMGKLVLIYGGVEAVKKSTALLTGILADSAGWQSIQAGDMSTNARGIIGRATGVAGSAVGMAARVGGAVTGSLFKPATNLIKRPFAAVGRAWSGFLSGNSQRSAQQNAKQQLANEKALNKLKEEEARKEREKQPPNPLPAKEPLEHPLGGAQPAAGMAEPRPAPPLPPQFQQPGQGQAQGRQPGPGGGPRPHVFNAAEQRLFGVDAQGRVRPPAQPGPGAGGPGPGQNGDLPQREARPPAEGAAAQQGDAPQGGPPPGDGLPPEQHNQQ